VRSRTGTSLLSQRRKAEAESLARPLKFERTLISVCNSQSEIGNLFAGSLISTYRKGKPTFKASFCFWIF